ncbi:hypothetical protein NMG60_11000284 [Bertholletia excelsa]
MEFEKRPNDWYSKLAGDMGFRSEIESLRSLENSEVVKQKIQSPRANKIPRRRDKIEGPLSQAYVDKHYELRQRMGHALLHEPKHKKNSQKPVTGKKESKNDELVKHMSNLPSYLQQGEKEENIQGKALNFGVLDWQRLEKWNHKKHIQPTGKASASSAGTSSSFKTGGSHTLRCTAQSNASLAPHKKQKESCHAHCKPSLEGFPADVKQSQRKFLQHGLETASGNSTFNCQQNLYQSEKSPHRSRSEKKHDRRNRKESDQKITRKETPLSGLRKSKLGNPLKDGTTTQKSLSTTKMEELQASECDLDQRTSTGEHSIVLLLPKHSPMKDCSEIAQTPKWTKTNRKSFSDGFSSGKLHSAELSSDIPHSCPLSTGAGIVAESAKNSHGLAQAQSTGFPNSVVNRSLHSEKTAGKLSQGNCTDVNASFTKHSRESGINTSERLESETIAPSEKERQSSPTACNGFNHGRIGRSLSFRESFAVSKLSSSYATCKSGPLKSDCSNCHFSEEVCAARFCSEILQSWPVPIPVGGRDNEPGMRWRSSNSAQSMDLSYADSSLFTSPNEMLSSVDAVGASKRLDQEAVELEPVKGRHPSPNRRFSFSFGRMSRSFSFKEGSTIPRLSSTYSVAKSGPVRSDEFHSLENENRNKGVIHCRSRSSPLRRLLDPILKSRAIKPHNSAENSQLLGGNLDATSELMSSAESLQHKKHEISMVQALLQLGGKDGLPFFKFAVNNKSDILIAMQKLTASGKDDSALIYSFYSVCEIKKKSSSWINQGNKEKRCGFGYNMTGQMKVFSSHAPDLGCKDLFALSESVLYGVDLKKGDQDTPEFTANRELAAIIVKVPILNSNGDGDHHDQTTKGKGLHGKGFLECSQDDRKTEKLGSTTVILPGGVHSLPNGGVPSPLIERWKSGGSCDCGGWDVGCKLKVLTNKQESCDLPRSSIPCSSTDHLRLYNQGGVHHNGLIFSMTPFKKGIYSVEFSASISLLQAFSICVSVLSSQKSFGLPDANNFSEEKLLAEPTLTGRDHAKDPFKSEAPTKYVPSPPPSPVGRV